MADLNRKFACENKMDYVVKHSLFLYIYVKLNSYKLYNYKVI